MIEIRRRERGEVLRRVDADSLCNADLSDANLMDADLTGANLTGANLTDAHLEGAYLAGANLTDAELTRARLFAADLTDADLTGARLQSTDLRFADLSGAVLSRANLFGANLNGAKLTGADLTNADLYAATFCRAELSGANLCKAVLGDTDFANCWDLGEALGLTTTDHKGRSYLDNSTLRYNMAHLPDVFLQGVGYTNHEIETLRALYTDAIQYYSCFLSHAGTDKDFAVRLRQDLITNNVSCWLDRSDMQGGRFFRAQINEAIKLHDKLILVCSRVAMDRDNVIDEVRQARARERDTGKQMLFPIRLDDFITSREAVRLGDRRAAEGRWTENWVAYLQEYHIPNFSGWKEDDKAYKAEFDKLLRDLKEPAKRPKGPTKRKGHAKA
jgi:hypothetical protein